MNYYSGWPYSDYDLYHHGIKGQKWGIRRYQNEDRTLTPLGKIRYGAAKAGKAVGNGLKATGKAIGSGAKAFGSAVSKSYKKRHPEKMTDEELQSAIKRLEMEKRYTDLKKGSKPQVNRGKKIVGDILESGIKSLANRAFNKLGDSVFKDEPKTTDYAEILKNPKNYNDNDINSAFKRMTQENGMYKLTSEMSKNKGNLTSQSEKVVDTRTVSKGRVMVNRIIKDSSSTPRDWSSKSSYIPSYDSVKESERRRRLYGPGGSAYK